MTKRRDTTGGPKPAAKPKAPATARKTQTAAKAEKNANLAALQRFIINAPVDAMIAVNVKNVRGDIYEAFWTEDGQAKAFRGSFHRVYLWVCACIVEDRLLPDIPTESLMKLYAARISLAARKAA